MKEIDINDLQKAWDRFLVESFYKFPNDKANHAAHVFALKNNISFEELKNLKRVPKTFHHQKVTVSRFVCAFLPTIAKVLWAHNIDQLDKLAAAVSKLNSDARERPVDDEKRRAEMSEIVSSKAEMRLAMKKKKAMGALYEKHGRNNQWGVTK